MFITRDIYWMMNPERFMFTCIFTAVNTFVPFEAFPA